MANSTDSSSKNADTSAVRYIFWKTIVCLLLTLPAFGVTLLVSALFGVAGSAAATEATGIAAYGRAIASFLGFAVFLLITARMWLRLKLGKLPLISFVLRETAAYGILLCLAVLLCAVTDGGLLRAGYFSLVLLPHLPLAFLLEGWRGALLPLFQLPLYALLAALLYLKNRRNYEKKIERGEIALEGCFEEKKASPENAIAAASDSGEDEKK